MLEEQSNAEPMPPSMAPMLAADVQDELMIAHSDLERLLRLLGDAGDSLMLHFYGAAEHLHAVLAAQAGQQADADKVRQALEHVTGAITAMQFQDMASQLIVHSNKRLRRCADRIASDVMGDDEDGEAVVEIAEMRPNPVTQDEVDAGSIELF